MMRFMHLQTNYAFKKTFYTIQTLSWVVWIRTLHNCSHSFDFIPVPVDLSPEERSELEDIRRRKGVLLQEIQRLREELRDAILEVEGLEASTEGR